MPAPGWNRAKSGWFTWDDHYLPKQHYNEPEKALQMTLKGPSGNEQGYADAFNEVFGA